MGAAGGWVGVGEGGDTTFKSNSSAFFALNSYPLSFNDETIIMIICYIALYPVQIYELAALYIIIKIHLTVKNALVL